MVRCTPDFPRGVEPVGTAESDPTLPFDGTADLAITAQRPTAGHLPELHVEFVWNQQPTLEIRSRSENLSLLNSKAIAIMNIDYSFVFCYI